MDQGYAVLFLLSIGFAAAAIPASIVDARTQRLPDACLIALFLIGVTYSLMEGNLPLDLLAALIAGGSLWVVARGFRQRRGYDGIGGGDVKLAAACGPWVGLWGIAPMFLIASLSALLVVGGMVFAGRAISRTTRIPFGPFLAAAAFLVWIGRTSGAGSLLVDNVSIFSAN